MIIDLTGKDNYSDSEKSFRRVRTEPSKASLDETGEYMEKLDRGKFTFWFKINLKSFIEELKEDPEETELQMISYILKKEIPLNDGIVLTVKMERRVFERNYSFTTAFHLAAVGSQNNLLSDIFFRVYDIENETVFYKKRFELHNEKTTQICRMTNKIDINKKIDLLAEVIIDDFNFVKDNNLPNGIINMGVTCYMNSYLQSIFHLKKFRYYVNTLASINQEDFIFCLQSLFYDLEKGKRDAKTFDLLKSFGWNYEQMFTQQDVQEFSLKLLDAIEEKSREQNVDQIITKELFKGKLQSYIKCVKVDFESVKEEDFFELQLNVASCGNVEDALTDLLQAEELSGDNAYNTDRFGRQEAKKGINILKVPDVLILNLNRTSYNLQTFEPEKLLKRFEFYEELDMAKYSREGKKYELYAVFVHIGFESGKGHYLVYLKIGDQWMEFNDSVIKKLTWEEVKQGSYGGDYRGTIFSLKSFQLESRLKTAREHAYMLMYVKSDKKDEILDNKGRVVDYSQSVIHFSTEKLKREKKLELRANYRKIHPCFEETFLGKETGVGELFYWKIFRDEEILKRYKKTHRFKKDKEDKNHFFWIPNSMDGEEFKDLIEKKFGKDFKAYVYKTKPKYLKAVREDNLSSTFNRYEHKQYVFLYKVKKEEKKITDPVLIITKQYNETENNFTLIDISLKDKYSDIKIYEERLENIMNCKLAVFFECNKKLSDLLSIKDEGLQFYELQSKSKSGDVIPLVIVKEESNTIERAKETWSQYKNSAIVNIEFENVEEEVIFDLYDSAFKIYEYLLDRKIIKEDQNYLYYFQCRGESHPLKKEDLTKMKVGNIVAEDPTLLIVEDKNFPKGCIPFDMEFYDFKLKKNVVIKKSENNIDLNLELNNSKMQLYFIHNEVFSDLFESNNSYFNHRNRKYPIVNHDFLITLKNGKELLLKNETILASDIDKVVIIPVQQLNPNFDSVTEMSIETDKKKSLKKKEPLLLKIRFKFFEENIILLFLIDKRIKAEDVIDEFEWFVINSWFDLKFEGLRKVDKKTELKNQLEFLLDQEESGSKNDEFSGSNKMEKFVKENCVSLTV